MNRVVVLFSERVFKILLISLIVHDSFCTTADMLRIIFEKVQLLLELVWMPDIIVILDSNIFSLSLGEEEIESVIGSEIFLAFYKSNLFIFWKILSYIFTRSIIEYENLSIFICLLDTRSESISQILPWVIGDDEYGYERIILHDFV